MYGNAKRTYNHLFENSNLVTDANLTSLQNTLVSLGADALRNALVELCPAQYSALPLVSFQNNVNMAEIALQQAKTVCLLKTRYPYIWVQPMGFYYDQDTSSRQRGEGQFSFYNYTYGSAVGAAFKIGRHFLINPAAGYTHSSLVWRENHGDTSADTVYFSPSFSFFTEKFSVNAIAQGGVDFFRGRRTIAFTGINEVPKQRHKSYNFLCGLDAVTKIELRSSKIRSKHENEKKSKNEIRYFLEPDIQVYYLKLYQKGFTEVDGGTLNLKVAQKRSTFMQANAGAKLVQQINLQNYTISPAIYVGFLSNIPFGSSQYVSEFPNLVIPSTAGCFSVEGVHKTVNQISLGFDCAITRCRNLEIKVSYRAELLSRMSLQRANVKLTWVF